MGADAYMYDVSYVCACMFLAVVAWFLYKLAVRRSPHEVDECLRSLTKGMDCKPEASTQDKSVCIVGAGITGLYAAYKLKGHCRVTLLEGSAAPGGSNRSAPVGMSETPVQYGCSGWTTSPKLTRLLQELGLERQEVKHYVASLVEGELEFKSNPKSSIGFWARAYSMREKLRSLLWWAYAFFLFYCFPIQNWSASDMLLTNNTGIDDILVPIGGINVFVDRCDLSRCPYTYFVRYAALYFAKTFFCVKEGNHAVIRRLRQELGPYCDFRCESRVAEVSGSEGCFRIRLETGEQLGPFHEVIMACQPHQVASMLPAEQCFKTHRECVSHFETVVARSVVHTDPSPWINAKDDDLELACVYDRTHASPDAPEHHYLHINSREFYHIQDFPKGTFVTVTYDNAYGKDVIDEDKIISSFQTTLSRNTVDGQRELPRLLHELHNTPNGVHLAAAAYLGVMWHEDGMTMAELACIACLRSMRQSGSHGSCIIDEKQDSECSSDHGSTRSPSSDGESLSSQPPTVDSLPELESEV